MGRTGRPVNIEFRSSDATTAGAVTITDTNSETVTLQSHERVVVYNGTISMDAAVGKATFFDDADAGGDIDSGELIAELLSETGGGVGAFETFEYPDGRGCSIGKTPKVIAANAGRVSIAAAAMIVNGKSEGVKPAWQADDFGQ